MKNFLAGLFLLALSAVSAFADNIGGFNGSTTFVPTVQNASYASGNAVGNLQTVNFFRTTGPSPSAIFDNLLLMSKGGGTTALTIYIFDMMPTATTCTDKSAFSLGNADIGKLAMAPFVLTPAVVGAGTTATTAQLTQITSMKNMDVPATTNLYICIVSGGTWTPATTTDLVVTISGALD